MAFATVAAIASIAGTIVSTMGAYQQSKAARAQAEFDAAVARNNQIAAEQDVAAIRERGKIQEQEHRDRIAQSIGAARAQGGAGGFLIDGEADETNVLLQADIAEAGALDILNIRDQVELDARNRQLAALDFGAQASMADFEARSQSPLGAAAGTLLEGVSKSAGLFDKAGFFKSKTAKGP